MLTLDGVVVSHLVLGEFGHGVRWRGHREGLWWQWLLALGLGLFGLTALVSCRIESLTVSRAAATVTVHKRPIWPIGLLARLVGCASGNTAAASARAGGAAAPCCGGVETLVHELAVADVAEISLRASGAARADSDTRRYRLSLELANGQRLLCGRYTERKHAAWIAARLKRYLHHVATADRLARENAAPPLDLERDAGDDAIGLTLACDDVAYGDDAADKQPGADGGVGADGDADAGAAHHHPVQQPEGDVELV